MKQLNQSLKSDRNVGIPSTTQNHLARSPDWYVHFRFKNIDEYAAINQLETISVFRLYRKMGELDDGDIQKIQNGFWNLYGTKKCPLIQEG